MTFSIFTSNEFNTSKLFIFLIIFLIFICSLDGQSTFPKEEILDKLVAELSLENPESTISVYGFTEAYEYNKVYKGGDIIPKQNYQYEIGSISKTFNAYLILDLIKDRPVFLNKRVGDYFSDYTESIRNITIAQLLNHTSGLKANFRSIMKESDPTQNLTDENLQLWFSKKKVKKGKIGKFKYSNAGFALLGMILEKELGGDWNSLVLKYVFKKGMNNSYVSNNEEPSVTQLKGHDEKGNSVRRWKFNRYDSAGGIISTIEDLKVYIDLTRKFEGELTKSTYLNQLDGERYSGLSWFTDKLTEDVNYIWHNGGTNGFSSYLGWIPNMDLGVIILVNKSLFIDDDSKLLLNAVIVNHNAK